MGRAFNNFSDNVSTDYINIWPNYRPNTRINIRFVNMGVEKIETKRKKKIDTKTDKVDIGIFVL